MDSASAPPDAIRVLLNKLWQRNLPAILERLDVLDLAAAAAQNGTLTTDLREQAITEAHKLAGSLGMFGYADATEQARKIEVLLERPELPSPERLTQLAAELRALLFPPGK